MELPATVFAEVVERARRYAHPAQPERRESARVPYFVPTKVFRLRGGVETSGEAAVIVDISATGLSVLHPSELSVGEEFVVCLPRSGPVPMRVRCQVTRCSNLGKDLLMSGARFLCVLDVEQEAA